MKDEEIFTNSNLYIKPYRHSETWPSYFEINEVIHHRLLRSNVARRPH